VRGPARRELNTCQLARAVGCSVYTVREQLACWRKRGLVERRAVGRGRGHGSQYQIDQFALARLLRPSDRRKVGAFPPVPLYPERSGIECGLAAGHRNAISKPPTAADLAASWRTAARLSGEPLRRALLRLVRLQGWRVGLSFAESQRLTAAMGAALGRIGKSTLRRYAAADCLAFLAGTQLEELRELIANWPRLLALAMAGFPRPRQEPSEIEQAQEQPRESARPAQLELAPLREWLKRNRRATVREKSCPQSAPESGFAAAARELRERFANLRAKVEKQERQGDGAETSSTRQGPR
jgi:hypothetical protein